MRQVGKSTVSNALTGTHDKPSSNYRATQGIQYRSRRREKDHFRYHSNTQKIALVNCTFYIPQGFVFLNWIRSWRKLQREFVLWRFRLRCGTVQATEGWKSSNGFPKIFIKLYNRFESCWPAFSSDVNGTVVVFNPKVKEYEKELDIWYGQRFGLTCRVIMNT